MAGGKKLRAFGDDSSVTIPLIKSELPQSISSARTVTSLTVHSLKTDDPSFPALTQIEAGHDA